MTYLFPFFCTFAAIKCFTMKKISTVAFLSLLIVLCSSCTKTEKNYYPDGNVQSIITYRMGKEHGKTTYFYDNPNTLEMEVEMKNGKRNGEFRRYFENGNLDTHCVYVNDSIEGVQTIFSPDGKKVQESTYKNGRLDGMYKAYHLNGEVSIEGVYKDGLYEGEWYYYDERGILVGEASFKQGAGTLTAYDSHGVKYKVTPYVHNKKEGKEVLYDPNGAIIQETVFKNDRIISQKVDSTLLK